MVVESSWSVGFENSGLVPSWRCTMMTGRWVGHSCVVGGGMNGCYFLPGGLGFWGNLWIIDNGGGVGELGGHCYDTSKLWLQEKTYSMYIYTHNFSLYIYIYMCSYIRVGLNKTKRETEKKHRTCQKSRIQLTNSTDLVCSPFPSDRCSY